MKVIMGETKESVTTERDRSGRRWGDGRAGTWGWMPTEDVPIVQKRIIDLSRAESNP